MEKCLTCLIVMIALLTPLRYCLGQYPAAHGNAGDGTTNKLYLYFPAVDDANFPELGGDDIKTSPLHRFDAAELTNYKGTTADLRNAIFQVVVADYCEFNVQVIQTTTAPPETFKRRNTVAAGTDSDPTASGTFGLAQAVDLGDATPVDYARVWAGTYQTEYGGMGSALSGSNSTLERWARSIGGTMAHEAGHNYGLSHADGLALADGEDSLKHHLMADGSNFRGEDRAGYRRHFSEHEYSILASNLGLSIQTNWNWDLLNRNAESAGRLRMSFLTTRSSVVVSGGYSGSQSPWVNPIVSGSLGTVTFKGVNYNRYQIEWSTAHQWSGGLPGDVPGGTHLGEPISLIRIPSSSSKQHSSICPVMHSLCILGCSVLIQARWTA